MTMCECGFRFAGPGEFRNCEAFVTVEGDSGVICPDCGASYINDVRVTMNKPEEESDLNAMSVLVEELAILDNKRKAAEAEVISLKSKCSELMAKLYNTLIVSQCKNGHKFDNGINVKPVLKETVFKAKGVDDETLFEYLSENDLGHIIKPSVHWKTLSSVMVGERELGKDLPKELFYVKEEPVIQFVGNGHIQFLEKML